MKWFKRRRLVEAYYTENGEEMSLIYDDGSEEKYYGSCTVWHRLPFMKRTGITMDSFLCEIYQYVKKWGNPYPTAHEKQKK